MLDIFVVLIPIFYYSVAGLLPRKTREGVPSTCSLHLHGSMEDCLPIYWQEHQGQGMLQLLSILQLYKGLDWWKQEENEV